MRLFYFPPFFEKHAVNSKILEWYRVVFCFAIAWQTWSEKAFILNLIKKPNCFPIEIFRYTGIGHFPYEFYEWGMVILVCTLILAAIGFFTRLNLGVSLILFVLIMGASIGCGRGKEALYTPWAHCIVVMNLLILLLSPKVGQKKIFQMFPRSSKGWVATEGWPVELLKFTLVMSYFGGGIVKIRSGLEWMNGYTLQTYLIKRHLIIDLPMAYEWAKNLNLMIAISVATVAMELVFPIVLFTNRKVGWLFALITLIVQIIFWFLIDLRWMKFYGWSYLVYFFEIVFILQLSKNEKSQKIVF